jgi:hypothetical protein
MRNKYKKYNLELCVHRVHIFPKECVAESFDSGALRGGD